MGDVEIREKILQTLSEILQKNDYLRFGQTIVITLGEDPFYMSDSEVLKRLQDFNDR